MGENYPPNRNYLIMSILGIHFGHDASFALVKDGKLVANISSERLTRSKKSITLHKQMLDYVLEQGGDVVENIEIITTTEYHQSYIQGDWLKLYQPDGKPILTTGGQCFFGNDIHTQCYAEFCGRKVPVVILPHHLSHCSAAFYTSNFEKAICVSVDACTGLLYTNSVTAYGNQQKLHAIECPSIMAANFYNVFTDKLGMGDPLYKAGSTMGWASYGRVFDKVIKNRDYYIGRMFFGNKHNPMTSDESTQWMWEDLSKIKDKVPEKDKYLPHYANVAATLQYLFEESILFAISQIKANGIQNLCLGGGSMLNCNINARIAKESQFKNISLFPACGDDGLAAGAALWVNHHLLNNPRVHYTNEDICYLGKNYGNNETPDFDYIAKRISDGKIVAWFDGRSELGPRALGHRSILADPRNGHNRDKLNFMIKNREWFRPYAPSVLAERSADWFDFDRESPFMLYTAQVKQPKEIPAVTHVDNSSRMQTVDETTNPNYYNLIKAFYNKTNVPLLLNTSLNGRDEPIVESPDDAMNFFNKTAVDILVLSGKIIER